MTRICTLFAEGYRADFRINRAPLSSEYAEIDIALHPGSDDSSGAINSSSTFVSVRDLHRLIHYFQAHLASLRMRAETESPVFVPLELGFQIQALEGELLSSNSGAFTVRLMVQVPGRPDAGRIYVGCEGSIEVSQVLAFVASITAAISDLDLHE